ncbi:MAG: hypothetical protein JSS04_22570 [Proteobacteria bacterium]|nr:hypothetical protein [Pseudomonadota bacterium]
MNEAEQNREVYAHVGLTLQMSQILEHAIVNAMVVLDLVPKSTGDVKTVDEWHERYDAYQELQFEKTLGRLVATVRAVTTLSDQVVADLKECIRKRNYIAHHFFRVRAEDFLDQSSRSRMIDDLVEIQELFERTIDAFEAALQPAWDRYGFTKERREQIADEYLREFSGKPDSDRER